MDLFEIVGSGFRKPIQLDLYVVLTVLLRESHGQFRTICDDYTKSKAVEEGRKKIIGLGYSSYNTVSLPRKVIQNHAWKIKNTNNTGKLVNLSGTMRWSLKYSLG